MNITNNFNRYEIKYLLSKKQYLSFLNLSEKYLQDDEYKEVIVKNIYYDDDDDYLIRNSISKPIYKEKLRLRGYDNLDQLYLEIKKKYNKVVYKRRIPVTFNELDYPKCNVPTDNQIGKEIKSFIDRYNPKPKYYISYNRTSYKDRDDFGLRITFDKDVIYRLDDLDLRSGIYGKSLLDKDEILMEIKSANGMPLWLVDIINSLKIYPTSYSKVGNIYIKEFIKERENNYESIRKHLH